MILNTVSPSETNVIGSAENKRHFPMAKITFLYPAIYKFSCKMVIVFFPFDRQNCTMTFGSWTYDSSSIDYHPLFDHVLTENFLPNEEWTLISFQVQRRMSKFQCCPIPYTLIAMHLVIHRMPTYYLTNLIIPVTIITLVAVVGFFTPATTTTERNEKMNLGLATLLAMCILLLMVSDQIPTTSDFIPLIGGYHLPSSITVHTQTHRHTDA